MAARHTTRAAMTAPRRACLGAALAQEGREADVGASGRAVSAGASRKQQCGLAPYPTDLTDKEWSRIEPLSPPCGVLGRKRSVDLREVLNANRYLARSGSRWRTLPKDFPPWQTSVAPWLSQRS